MTDNGPWQQPDGFDRPLDYPEDVGLPPPVYPAPHPDLPGSGYYAPYPGFPGHQTPPPGTNGKAIVALVASVAGVICCGLPSLVGLIFGLIAMSETKRTGQNGYKLALAAVVISALIMTSYVVYVLVYAVVNGAAPD